MWVFFSLVETGVALAAFVNIPALNLGGKAAEKFLLRLSLLLLLLLQTKICSLRQKKMDASEIPKSRKVMFLGKDSETNATTSMMTAMMEDIQDNRNVTEVALALVEDAIAVAVQFVEEARNPIKNIKWITHGEFTVEKGRKQIEKFVLTWEYQSRWVHYTEFIKKEELSHTFRYIYCVRWSIPTAQVPMPRVSATAYFTIKINKSKPPVSSSFDALFPTVKLQGEWRCL
ncbi:A-kinase anchor protein 14 isoform X1 [Marmota marmota marmota]|uniref:A-kinase anchor protein 14 isoform X1 n=1 Tax=Marmota marmota marmota TaxID=9994 RepID=UPI0020927DC9|nr:A-kinase anchor protein 14 isoform X1 [Marmota marmota marmota]